MELHNCGFYNPRMPCSIDLLLMVVSLTATTVRIAKKFKVIADTEWSSDISAQYWIPSCLVHHLHGLVEAEDWNNLQVGEW